MKTQPCFMIFSIPVMIEWMSQFWSFKAGDIILSRLRVLTAYSETPVMTKTPVGTDLLESLKILAHLIVQAVGKDLAELAILNVLLPVEEPIWDLVLTRVVHDRNDALNLFLREFSGTLGHVDVSFLADDVRESSTTAFDTRHSEHDLTTA